VRLKIASWGNFFLNRIAAFATTVPEENSNILPGLEKCKVRVMSILSLSYGAGRAKAQE
jgi:hypothetical protein